MPGIALSHDLADRGPGSAERNGPAPKMNFPCRIGDLTKVGERQQSRCQGNPNQIL